MKEKMITILVIIVEVIIGLAGILGIIVISTAFFYVWKDVIDYLFRNNCYFK